MIEQSLVYIYSTKPQRRFVGCGALLAGGYIATCRHVWAAVGVQDAGKSDSAPAEIEFPFSRKNGIPAKHAASLIDECDDSSGERPDLVLLKPHAIPDENIMVLPLAPHFRFEVGEARGIVGLRRNLQKPNAIQVAEIKGVLAATLDTDGRRQFTGDNPSGFWLERGSSGSPVFREGGIQLAGIFSLSELGVNEGASHLHEAFVVPATTIHSHLRRVIAERAAQSQHFPVTALRPVLEMLGAQDIPIAEIPQRIQQFIESARNRADEPIKRSNEGADIEAVIEASRKKLGKLDISGARDILQAKIKEEEETRARRLVALLKERAAIERLAFDYDSAKGTLREILALSIDDIGAHIELGDLWRATGNLEIATTAYRNAENVAARTDDQRGLSLSQSRIGDVLASQGDRNGALVAYRAALGIAETLSRRDPNNTEWQRNLSVSHSRIGDILVLRGDRQGALEAYRASLAIAEALARGDAKNTRWQRDLSICQDRIGNVLLSQGDPNGAVEAYDKALVIRKTLTDINPANTQWQRDLSVSHNKIGDVLESRGDLDGALAAYRAALGIRQALADRDSANTQWQRDIGATYDRIGDVLARQDDPGGALTAYRTAFAITETLCRLDPANTEWQRDLSINRGKIGHALAAQGDLDGAVTSHRAAVAILKTLVQHDPTNTEWQRNLSVGYNGIGSILVLQGNYTEAVVAHRAAFDIAKRLAGLDPANAQWQKDLTITSIAFIEASIKISEAEPSDAPSYLASALDIARMLQASGRLTSTDSTIVSNLVQQITSASKQ
jgi:tetratricopeptide (TPR) repeat protein